MSNEHEDITRVESRRDNSTHDDRTIVARGSGVVLIVDDQEMIRLIESHYLSELGVRIEEAASGAQAWERVTAGGIDLVVLDIGLPDVNGFDLCRRIKKDPRTALIPVIIVTGMSSRADRLAGLRAGASDFLSKPVDREELLVRSRMLLDLHITRKALEEVRALEYRRQNEALRSTFKRYVSPVVAERILADGKTPSERYDAVVLFADLRGFTHMSEMLSPADLVKLLNQFFARMTRIVHLAGGAVFHFAGDALMAGFGVPATQPDFAARAARCGAQMIAECAPMFERWPVAVGLGIGINRGEVIAGNIGSDDFMSYTLIGDTVNVASRLTARAQR